MKKLIIGLAIAGSMLVTGCGKNETTLVMGTNANFPPFEYVGGANGDEIQGFDIDLAKQIAKDAGKTLKVEDMNFDSLIVALNAGKIDFIGSGMTITPERQKSVNFSQPYYEATQVILVQKDNVSLNKVDDIKDKKIAVQLGSTGNLIANKLSRGNVAEFNSGFEAIMELKNGKVDLVIFDSEPATNFLAKNPELKMIEIKFDPEFYGFAVAKNNPELLKTINTSLDNMRKNGEYQALITKYMK